MSDPKFEKGVRQKMEGLEFIPSETVWANIEKAVAEEHRRRAPFYFWRFAIPGLLLAGAVGIGYFSSRPSRPATAKTATAVKAASTITAPAITTAPPAATTIAGPKTAVPTIAAPKTTATPTTTTPTTPMTAATTTPGEASSRISFTRTPTTAHHPSSHRPTTAATTKPAPASDEVFDAAHEANTEANVQRDPTSQALTPRATQTVASLPAAYLYQPALVGQRDAVVIRGASLSAKKAAIALDHLENHKRPWEAGFTGGIGISRLNRLNISPSSSLLSSAATFYNINSPTYSYDKHYVSDVRPDLSFEGGIYLQKPLADRWILNLGMNLHYYSTRISVGKPVSTYVPAALSLISSTVTTAAQSTTVYAAGDNELFTNRYYFLELPVGLQFKVNKSRMIPVFLEGGFSLSRLMGSNALFYDSHSGVYYKDATVLQKTQFNLSSAVMVGLPFHGLHIEVGPQLQYGLTPLINNSSLGDQHFLYTGIRLVILPVSRR